MFKWGKIVKPPVHGADCVDGDPSNLIADINNKFSNETGVSDFLSDDILQANETADQDGNAIYACVVALNEHGVANNIDHWRQVLEFLVSLKLNSWLCAATAPKRMIADKPTKSKAKEWPESAVIASTLDDPDKNEEPDVIKALIDIEVPVVCGQLSNAAMKDIINSRSTDAKDHNKSILQIFLTDGADDPWDDMRARFGGLEVFASFFAIPQVFDENEAPSKLASLVSRAMQLGSRPDTIERFKMPLFVFDGALDIFPKIFDHTETARIAFLEDLIGEEKRFLLALSHDDFQKKSDEDLAQMIANALNHHKICRHSAHEPPTVIRVAPALAAPLGITYLEVRPVPRDIPSDQMPHLRVRQGAK